MNTPLIEVQEVTRRFGSLEAIAGVSFSVLPGEVHCLLGDNGAGKSTLIKILAGVHHPSSGQILFEGQAVSFASPRDALNRGIAAVYQDLALIPLMSITRNFFLGREPVRGGPLGWFDQNGARRIVRRELSALGLDVRDPDQPAGTLSGGERQTLAIARAVYFGARLLILDEPTAALGVAQTTRVLRTVRRLRDRGVGLVLITHNVRHAYAVGDRFTVLDRGRSRGTFARNGIDMETLQNLMAGGKSMSDLSRDLESAT